LVEEIEELCAEFKILRLGYTESFDDRKVKILLTWPAQDVAAYAADVCADGSCDGRAA
jgi:hypothetical protein